MASLPINVLNALISAGAEMYGSKNSHKNLRSQINILRNQLAITPGIELTPLVDSREQVYPVMTTVGTAGFLGLKMKELCFLGVDSSGDGCISAGVTTFDDFLIYLCNYKIDAIRYIFERAMQNDPMTYDEAEQMDMNSNIHQTHVTNNVQNGQIVNATGHAYVNAPVNIAATIPPQFQEEYNELVYFLQHAKASPTIKNSRISEFIQSLSTAGFGAIIGEIAKYLFNLV